MSGHGGSGRWLAASLALNVFLAGALGGGAWRWWSTERAPAAATAQAPQRSLRHAADELGADRRRAFRLGLRDARREVQPQIELARENRREVLRLVAAAQLDKEALAAALARVRAADAAVRARLEDSVVEFAASLGPEDRRRFADGLQRRTPLNPAPQPPAAKASGPQPR